jgi:alkylhydroperoxidase family enzyme
MARIPTVREDDPGTPPEAREFLKRVEGGLGEVFNAVRLLANHPQQANALIGFVRSVRQNNSLTPTLTELAYTTASVANGCDY